MAAYKLTATYDEDGFGPVTDVFLVTDTYDDLMDIGSAVEVNVFQVGDSTHELDIAAGTFGDDEISFEMSEAAAETADDVAAIDLVLGAQDPSVFIYVARFINPTLPVAEPEDVEFTGRVRSDMTHTDDRWSGAEWSGSIAPLKQWKCSAGSYAVAVLLDAKLKSDEGDEFTGLVDALVEDEAWITANVADRLGYFKSTGGDGYGHRQVRWANLVRMDTLFQKLIDLAVPAGITATWEVTATNLLGTPTRWQMYPANATDGIQTRYVLDAAFSYDDASVLTTGGTADGAMYVTWWLLTPPKDQRAASWLRYETLAELLYAVAQALGMFVEIIQTSGTAVTIRLSSRAALVGGEVLIKDATEAERDLTALDVEDEPLFRGDAWHLTREGFQKFYYWQTYGAESRDTSHTLNSIAKVGEPLALTLSAPKRALRGLGQDIYTFKENGSQLANIPHNAVFWGETERTLWAQEDGLQKRVQQNAEAVHTAIYMQATGHDETGIDHGVDGLTILAPVAHVNTQIGGVDRGYTELSAYANDLYGSDRALFESEYQISSQYTCSFRAVVDGPMDWRHMATARTVTLDAVTYVVRSVTRPFGRAGTRIGLHAESRFAFAEPEPAPVPLDDPPDVDGIMTNNDLQGLDVVTGSVSQFNLVARRSDGTLERALAHHDHFARVVGIALSDATDGEYLYWQATGRVFVGFDLPFSPGDRLFLRTPDGVLPAWINISTTALEGVDEVTEEDMYLEIGQMEASGVLNLDIKPGAVYYPPLA